MTNIHDQYLWKNSLGLKNAVNSMHSVEHNHHLLSFHLLFSIHAAKKEQFEKKKRNSCRRKEKFDTQFSPKDSLRIKFLRSRTIIIFEKQAAVCNLYHAHTRSTSAWVSIDTVYGPAIDSYLDPYQNLNAIQVELRVSQAFKKR